MKNPTFALRGSVAVMQQQLLQPVILNPNLTLTKLSRSLQAELCHAYFWKHRCHSESVFDQRKNIWPLRLFNHWWYCLVLNLVRSWVYKIAHTHKIISPEVCVDFPLWDQTISRLLWWFQLFHCHSSSLRIVSDSVQYIPLCRYYAVHTVLVSFGFGWHKIQ